MGVRMCACVHVAEIHAEVIGFVEWCTCRAQGCMGACVRGCTRACVHACMCACMHVCMLVRMDVRMHVRMLCARTSVASESVQLWLQRGPYFWSPVSPTKKSSYLEVRVKGEGEG